MAMQKVIASHELHTQLQAEVQDVLSKHLRDQENSARTGLDLWSETNRSSTKLDEACNQGPDKSPAIVSPGSPALLGLLENERNLLDDLLAAVRTADAAQLNTLINLIRGHVTKQQLHSHIRRSFPASPSQMWIGEPTAPEKTRRRMLGRIQDIVNPIISVPATPWTTVTDDDDYVSHLMSLWFTWAHQWWQWVDKELFIEAMKSRDLSNAICTPYLVNVILADACLLDTLTQNETEPNAWIRDEFYNEGKRGIDAEGGQVSLALVGALGVQWTYLNTNGQERLGNPILYQQMYLARNLDTWRARIGQLPDITPELLAKVDKSLDRLSWTLYALGTFTVFNLEKFGSIRPPRRPKPRVDHNSCGDQGLWVPYPQPKSSVVFHTECHYRAFLSLAELLSGDETTFSDDYSLKSPFDRYGHMYKDLENWPRSLPDCMRLNEECIPHVAALHALHRWIMVVISKQFAAFDSGQPRAPTLFRTPQSDEKDRWHETAISFSLQISSIFEQLRTAWGADHYPVIIVQPASIAAFPLLEELHIRPESQNALIGIIVTLCAASRRFKVCNGVLGMIQRVAEQANVRLPEPCQELIEVVKRHTSVDRLDRDGNLMGSGVDWLLEKWDDLGLA